MTFREIFRQNPFLRILLPLLVGILFASYFKVNDTLCYALIIVGFTGMIGFIAIPTLRKSYSLRTLFGIFCSLFLLGLAVCRVNIVESALHLSSQPTSRIYKVELIEKPVEKTNSYLCIVDIKESLSDKTFVYQTAKAILYFAKDSSVKTLKPGDLLLLNSSLNRVKNAGNPYEFDYAAYLKTQHILYSAYINTNSWIKLGEHSRKSISILALEWRDSLLDIYREKGIRDESFDILAALTLGYKTTLDPEIKRAWADAGAMHVLAVSGLHVGIIYIIMKFILGFLGKVKYGQWIKGVLLLLSLWMYALLTGLSPSVMRAASMFSFVIGGEVLKRYGGIYNSLAASAVFLLLYNPFLLFTVGFQFSYLAVVGIVFFQARFEKLLYVRNFILRKLWQLTTVAIAAQIATFPLAIYYFNQFPTYFLLSGYIVILMAGVLIYLSILLLLLAKIDFLSDILAWILHHLVGWMNWLIVQIHHLPGAVIRDFTFTEYQVVLLYLSILCLIFILVLKRKKAVFSLLILLLCIQIPVLISKLKAEERELVVFNAGRNSLIGLRNKEKVFLLIDKDLKEKKIERLTKPYLMQKGVVDIQIDTLRAFDYRDFDGTVIVSIDRKLVNANQVLDSIKADYLILRKNALKSDSIWVKKGNNRVDILDGSIYLNDLKRITNRRNVPSEKFFQVGESGAYIQLLSSQKMN
ncbi:ComEC/Rec2 family competence protein [Marinifilum sp. RC60d5]|uniref:ComEC/Rec2 family competence protein n=1 Tax=Marinifilum sp. RC60d5 TaxID=3458414 RepID=UPI0040361557